LYVVVGLGVAIAVFISAKPGQSPGLWFRLATALPFWPLYMPILLAGSSQRQSGAGGLESSDRVHMPAPRDGIREAIPQVDAELEAARDSLDGWAEDVLARERNRIRELREAWSAQADRIREMNHLLASGIPRLALAPENSTDDRLA